MGEEKHTDHTWLVVHDGHPGLAIETNKSLRIARVYSDELTHTENGANAHLIADAPRLKRVNEQLVEALEQIAKGAGAFSHDPLEHCSNIVEEMKAIALAALAAAEQEEEK